VVRLITVRVLGALATLFIAASLAFFLSRLAGDPVRNMLGDLATADQVAEMRAELGYDRPLVTQWLDFLGDLVRGDLGESLRYGQSNLEVIGGRIGASVQLALAAILIAVVVGVPVGLIAARREGSWIDRTLMAGSLLGQSVPAFWLAMISVLVFAVEFGWFPAGGSGTWRHLVLPACTLATLPLARIARLSRSSAIDVLQEPFIVAAQARGVPDRRVLFGHVIRNISLPVLTIIGLQAGGLLSGAVTIEVVFGWPGMGQLAVQAVQFRDFPLVQSIVLVGAAVFVGINLLVDVLSGLADPRVRVTGG
jgi:peptide/nickel transport system permease protein